MFEEYSNLVEEGYGEQMNCFFSIDNVQEGAKAYPRMNESYLVDSGFRDSLKKVSLENAEFDRDYANLLVTKSDYKLSETSVKELPFVEWMEFYKQKGDKHSMVQIENSFYRLTVAERDFMGFKGLYQFIFN